MEREFSGNTVEEAIEKGLESMHKTREEVEIKILNEGKSGLFGLMGSQPALIKIISKQQENGLAEEGQRHLKEILTQIGVSSRIESRKEGEEFQFLISSPQAASLIGRDGRTLEALQYLLQLLLKKEEEASVSLLVDVENYVQKRRVHLKKLVEQLSGEVLKQKQEKHLSAMPPRERRYVHLLLKDHQELTTRSEGEGEARHIVIALRPPA